MRIILMAAGTGERLWPMSTKDRPKQFIPLFPHPQDPTKTISMIQRVYAHLQRLGKSDLVSVVTTKDLALHVHEQLGNVPIHELPYRKDTFGSVSYAALDATRRFGMRPQDSFLFVPVDHWTEESFYLQVIELTEMVRVNDSAIGLLGVTPKTPSSSYGYMEVDKTKYQEFYRVEQFREKPSEKEAHAIMYKSFWNAGVFAFTVKTAEMIIPFFSVMSSMKIEAWALDKWYESLSDLPFDREVLETYRNLFAMKYDGVWDDVGTWDRAMKYVPTQVLGEGDVVDCVNVNVVNALSQPVIVAGLNDVVVVAAENGIIVTRKSLAPKLKEIRTRV